MNRKLKKLVEMKKILFTLMMLFTLSISVMADEVPVKENAKNIENLYKNELKAQAAKYDFNVNYRKIGCCLEMSIDQLDDFELFFDQFKDNMNFAYNECSEASRDGVVKNIVNKNLNEMRHILNEKQYKKYLLLMNTTLRNRGFEL
jgi:hypothetical protein